MLHDHDQGGETSLLAKKWAHIRKNWMFSDSPRGAATSAATYSLVETYKANNLDPAKYFEVILTGMPEEPFQTQPELLEQYMPWSSSAMQETCK